MHKKKGVPQIDPVTAAELLEKLAADPEAAAADRQSRIEARAWLLAMPTAWRGEGEPDAEWQRVSARWMRMAQLHPQRLDITLEEIAERQALEEEIWREAEAEIDAEDKENQA